MSDLVWLVVGLGNPGPDYAHNRHNAGAMALDVLAGSLNARFSKYKSGADVADVRPVPGGPRLILAKPRSFMNTSGGPVSGLARFFRVPAEQILVVHDELDLPFMTVRLKRGGGEGGHNGLRSISQSLGTKDYCRLRIGIGRPPGRMDSADFVLRNFSASQRKELERVLTDAADAVLAVVSDGWERAQNRVNTARN